MLSSGRLLCSAGGGGACFGSAGGAFVGSAGGACFDSAGDDAFVGSGGGATGKQEKRSGGGHAPNLRNTSRVISGGGGGIKSGKPKKPGAMWGG